MRLLILHVPECPGAEALESRLAPLLAARPDIQVVRQVVTTEDEARRLSSAAQQPATMGPVARSLRAARLAGLARVKAVRITCGSATPSLTPGISAVIAG